MGQMLFFVAPSASGGRLGVDVEISEQHLTRQVTGIPQPARQQQITSSGPNNRNFHEDTPPSSFKLNNQHLPSLILLSP